MCAASKDTWLAGRYDLLELAGEGGMATVWRSHQHGAAGFLRTVAVKRILPHLVQNREFIAMFVEEARVGSLLQHPNIVQILDFNVDDRGFYFLVMEWIQGVDFGRYVQAHQLRDVQTEWPLVTAIGIESLRGLGAAHERLDDDGKPAPVIHRDVTPQNILIGSNGIAKLTDFGLSRAMDRSRMTQPDIIKGKLAYLAPEISHGAEATVQSDLFSLGVVLWEALAGRRLYQGASDIDVFLAARKAEIPPLSELRPDIPAPLVRTLEVALRHEPEDRFKSAHHMARAFAEVLRRQPRPTDAKELSRSVIESRLVVEQSRLETQENPTVGLPKAASPARPPAPKGRQAPPPTPMDATPMDGTGKPRAVQVSASLQFDIDVVPELQQSELQQSESIEVSVDLDELMASKPDLTAEITEADDNDDEPVPLTNRKK